jgi:hypothetical protein
MKNFFKKKILVFLLMLSVTFCFTPTRVAYAGGFVASFLTGGASNLINAIVTGNANILAIAFIAPLGPGTLVGSCIGGLICGSSSSGSGVILQAAAQQVGSSCNYPIPVTFYNPRMNVSYYQPIVWDPSTGCSGDGNWIPYVCTGGYVPGPFTPDPSFNETNRQVAIYRFTLPVAGSSQTDINTWFISHIPASVGNGWMNYPTGSTGSAYTDPWTGTVDNYSENYLTGSESAPLVTLPYSQLCSGNVCHFTDNSAPQNSYVAYVAKILGSYNYSGDVHDNKFFNTDNSSAVYFPPYNNTLGNAIAGPYQLGTAVCPTRTLTITKSGSGTGVVTGSGGSSFTCDASSNPCSIGAITGGTSITLTATPAVGSTFTGWSGACSGTNATCTPNPLVMDADKGVTATFSAQPPTVDNVTISSSTVVANATNQYTITVIGSNPTGVSNLTFEAAMINHDGVNAGIPRGLPAWSSDNFSTSWGGPQVLKSAPMSCGGGGVAGIYDNGGAYGPQYMNLVSCNTSGSGNTRTTSFVVTFNTNFTSPVANNTLSGYAVNSAGVGVAVGWVPFGTFGLGSITNGTCGSSNGQTLASAPSSGFCNAGSYSGLSGSGPWTWSCIGANGGTTASCSAATTSPPPTYSCATCSNLFSYTWAEFQSSDVGCTIPVSVVTYSPSCNHIANGGGSCGLQSSDPFGNIPICAPSYSCTGSIPANATMFAGDNVGLAANTPYTYWATDTGTRCQYSCNGGFNWNGSSCVFAGANLSITVNIIGKGIVNMPGNHGEVNCQSSVDAGTTCNYSALYALNENLLLMKTQSDVAYPNSVWSGACSGSGFCSLTMDQNKTVTATFTGAYSCTGSVPANATMFTGDNVGLVANTPYTYSASDTLPTKCQYSCNSGYNWDGISSCVSSSCTPDPGCPGNTCTGTQCYNASCNKIDGTKATGDCCPPTDICQASICAGTGTCPGNPGPACAGNTHTPYPGTKVCSGGSTSGGTWKEVTP